ncbi:MAG: T9SS type A sorting domain-containing protein [Bacteroidota bacterium]
MKSLYVTLVALLVTLGATAQVDTIRNNTGGNATWASGTAYYLDGYVFVEDGDTLTIEAGTVIRGLQNPTSGSQQGNDTTVDDASALIVARGGYIIAEGTAANPIIFTSDKDADLNSITDVTPFEQNLWGGIIVLGSAGTNTDPVEQQIEGIPSFETRAVYGGTQNDDNSGILKYISIRHGGSLLGQDNEINGLTLGGVGSGTTIDFVEVFSNQDDGFEWFGGTVNNYHLISAFCGDDAYDWDQGFRGKGQFWFAIQRVDAGGEGGEFDGGTSPEDGTPFATPQIVNATFIGRGPDKGNRTLRIRDNSGGFFHNNIFADFGRGVEIEIRDGATEFTVKRAREGQLAFKNNIFWNVNATGTSDDAFIGAAVNFKTRVNGMDVPAQIADSTDAVAEAKAVGDSIYAAGNNVYANPNFVSVDSVSRLPDANQSLDPRSFAGIATTDLDAGVYDSTFFTTVGYKGAFDTNGSNYWLTDWTALDLYGFLSPTTVANDNRIDFELNAYPNPTNGLVKVTANNLKAANVTVIAYDATGRRIVLKEVATIAGTLNAEVDFTAQAPGMYYITLEQDGILGTMKVEVE